MIELLYTSAYRYALCSQLIAAIIIMTVLDDHDFSWKSWIFGLGVCVVGTGSMLALVANWDIHHTVRIETFVRTVGGSFVLWGVAWLSGLTEVIQRFVKDSFVLKLLRLT